MKRKKMFSVSEISSYADDPVMFCKNQGQAYDSKAAKMGSDSHDSVGKSIVPSLIFIVLGLVGAGVAWTNGIIG